MNAPRLMLTILAGGTLFGALLGQMAHPEMKFTEGEDWRSRLAPQFSTTSMRFVDAGPEELEPGWYGPNYRGPSYLPAAFASDHDLVYEYAPHDGHALASDPVEPAYYAAADPEFAEPGVPAAIDRASEAAAEVAAALSDSPPPRIAGSSRGERHISIPSSGAVTEFP
jgi:hypothetical protein